MKIDEENKDIVEKLHLLSGLPKANIQALFQSFVVVTALNYLEGRPTVIPFLGQISIDYKGDEAVNFKAKAIVELKLEPSDTLIRIVGDAQDNESRIVEDLIKKQIKETLVEKIDR